MAIPVLAIPCINRPDLLERCLTSIDVPVGALFIIDNSPDGLDFTIPPYLEPFAHVEAPPRNLGVAASWNLAIKCYPDAPWWCIANADTEFGSGDLARLAQEMDQFCDDRPRLTERSREGWVGVNGDWRVFGLTRWTVQRVGLFDENYHPCYDEDADYERRCALAGVPWYFIDGTSTHAGSAAIRSDERYARANARTHPANDAYYLAKWGGYPRRGERFTTPFDSGAPVSAWSLDIDRLRDQAW